MDEDTIEVGDRVVVGTIGSDIWFKGVVTKRMDSDNDTTYYLILPDSEETLVPSRLVTLSKPSTM